MNIPRPRIRMLFAELSVLLATMALVHHSEAQSRKVRIAIPGYTIAVLSFFAAKTNGYFTSEGFDVELIAMRAPTANLALLGGNVEFSSVPMVGLTTALRGAPLKVLFCQNDKPQHAVFAKPDIQTIKALRGKKIAVAGPGIIDDILLREVLQANGIDAARDATILAVGAADTRLSALLSGTVDAAVLIAPFTFSAKEMGLKELVVFGDEGFVLPSGGIVVRDDFLKTDAATVERFTRATLMGFLFSRDNRGGAIRVLTRNLKVDEATATKIYDSSRPTFTSDGALSEDVQKKMIAFASKLSTVKELVSPERVFDFTHIRKANAALQAKRWHPGS